MIHGFRGATVPAMVPAFLRSLSARILLGFAVLIITFGATSVWIVSYMTDLSDEISVVRSRYLSLAIASKELEVKQTLLQQYLKEELPGEATVQRVEQQVSSKRKSRDKTLVSIQETLDSMKDLPRGHSKLVGRTLDRIEEIRKLINTLEPLYETMLALPPIDRVKSASPPADQQKLHEAVEALGNLISRETGLTNKAKTLAATQKNNVSRVGENLERNADRLRQGTLALGIIAVVIGVLITFWVTLTLRPLRRLRDAAAKIAQGEYGMRIDQRGPAEVAELAGEFNVMARAIEERERELVRSERLAAVGKMAAMITHEVRNPLSSIALNTELLGDELDALPDNTEARALVRAITNEVDRLTAITEEYLAFARLPKPRVAAESINHVVSSLATFVREDLAARGVSLDVALGDDLPKALIDEGQLRQSLLNLVRNAAEALGGRTGHVWLTTRAAAGAQVEVEVRDDGPGIEEDVRARLFDPFFSTKEGGTGLGLALTHQIIKDHGGDIQVTSPPGAGATFVVRLPAEA